MKLKSYLALAAAMLLTGTSAVYAFGKYGHWRMTPGEKAEFVTDRVSKHLELDDQQRDNFARFADLVAGIAAAAHASKSEHVAEVREMLDEPVLDQARALEMVRQKTQLMNERAPEVIASLAVFLDSLRPGQKRELQAFIEHHRRHHRHHRHADLEYDHGR